MSAESNFNAALKQFRDALGEFNACGAGASAEINGRFTQLASTFEDTLNKVAQRMEPAWCRRRECKVPDNLASLTKDFEDFHDAAAVFNNHLSMELRLSISSTASAVRSIERAARVVRGDSELGFMPYELTVRLPQAYGNALGVSASLEQIRRRACGN